jgi:hypothetical protein
MSEGPTIVIDRSEATSVFPYRVAPRFLPSDISKSAYLNRVVPLVERGEMPASVIALADTAVPSWVLEWAGFDGDEILKSEARARPRVAGRPEDREFERGTPRHARDPGGCRARDLPTGGLSRSQPRRDGQHIVDDGHPLRGIALLLRTRAVGNRGSGSTPSHRRRAGSGAALTPHGAAV